MSCNSACAVDHDGFVWCWGTNHDDRLQIGSGDDPLTTARSRQDVTDMEQVAGADIFLGRSGNGSVYGRTVVPSILVRFSQPISAIDLHAGGEAWCATTTAGQVFCHLRGRFSDPPQLVDGLSDVVSTVIGSRHFCALKRDGTVWCWGNNEYAQTGIPLESSNLCHDGTVMSPQGDYSAFHYCVNRPTQVPDLADVVEVSAGGDNTCVRKRDQTVWCWGANRGPYEPDPGQGLVGDGLPNTETCPYAPTYPPEFTPTVGRPCRRRPSQLRGLVGATSISVAEDHSCVLLASGEIWCWGSRALGRDAPSAVPVQVPLSIAGRDR